MAGCCGFCAQRTGRVHKTRAWKTRVNNLQGYDVWVYKCQECRTIDFAWCHPRVCGASTDEGASRDLCWFYAHLHSQVPMLSNHAPDQRYER